MSASRGVELDTEGALHSSIHAMEKEVADGHVHILVRCSTCALRVSAAKVVLSSKECFRNILPFIVKMRYEHVDEHIRRQYRRLGPHD